MPEFLPKPRHYFPSGSIGENEWLAQAFADYHAWAAAQSQPAADPVDVRETLADMIGAAYHAGATDVHRAWVEGNGQSEADFGEAASDYIAHVEPQFAAIVYREGPRNAE